VAKVPPALRDVAVAVAVAVAVVAVAVAAVAAAVADVALARTRVGVLPAAGSVFVFFAFFVLPYYFGT
jgi:hypothetical protein